ncbi:hypothetical protein L195_g051714, partial [Trifolium pratense]
GSSSGVEEVAISPVKARFADFTSKE